MASWELVQEMMFLPPKTRIRLGPNTSGAEYDWERIRLGLECAKMPRQQKIVELALSGNAFRTHRVAGSGE